MLRMGSMHVAPVYGGGLGGALRVLLPKWP